MFRGLNHCKNEGCTKTIPDHVEFCSTHSDRGVLDRLPPPEDRDVRPRGPDQEDQERDGPDPTTLLVQWPSSHPPTQHRGVVAIWDETLHASEKAPMAGLLRALKMAIAILLTIIAILLLWF